MRYRSGMSPSRVLLVAASIALSACSEDEPATAPLEDSATADSFAEDTEVDSAILDSSPSDTTAGDTESIDSGTPDTGSGDTGSSDTGSADTGSTDTGSTDTGSADTGSMDTGSTDSGSSDTGADASPADPCSPLPSGLTTWTKTDSASVGTPDTYFFDVNPGDPFCATITGGGGGSWSVNVSNGTSAGLYCSGSPKCSILVPSGQLTLLVTAVTDDIGGYTLTVRYKPR
jgi:hypothetical protein